MPFLICLKSENKHKIKSPTKFMEWIAKQETKYLKYSQKYNISNMYKFLIFNTQYF